jgi:hypothetical protein
MVILNFFQSRYDSSGRLMGAIGCFISLSYDNAISFTAPRMIPIEDYAWSATSDDILELEDGSLVLPVYAGNPGERSSALAVISRDRGVHWDEVYVIARDAEGKIDFQEPALVLMDDGSLGCVLRTAGAGGYQYWAVSEDGGRTWSGPVSMGIQGQAADLMMTREGILICAYRDFSPRGVSFVRSYNRGKSWEKEIPLFSADGDCAYPSLIVVGDEIMTAHYTVPRNWEKDTSRKSSIGSTWFSVHRPSTPKGFKAVLQPGDRGVHLRWSPVSGVRYYVVYKDTLPDFQLRRGLRGEGNDLSNPTEVYYTDVLVDSGKTYYYRVTAVVSRESVPSGSAGESLPTAAETVRVE